MDADQCILRALTDIWGTTGLIALCLRESDLDYDDDEEAPQREWIYKNGKKHRKKLSEKQKMDDDFYDMSYLFGKQQKKKKKKKKKKKTR